MDIFTPPILIDPIEKFDALTEEWLKEHEIYFPEYFLFPSEGIIQLKLNSFKLGLGTAGMSCFNFKLKKEVLEKEHYRILLTTDLNSIRKEKHTSLDKLLPVLKKYCDGVKESKFWCSILEKKLMGE